MKIGNVELNNNVFLAPMAGYTDIAFREQCKKFGAGLTYTEMISAKGLIYDSEKTKALLVTSNLEDVKAVQIFGHEPEVMAKACQHPLLEKFDIIDINMGCPAPKIYNNGDGSKLLENMKLAEQIVLACKKATNKPITVKMRLGVKDNVAVPFAKMLEKAGVSAITVHGRTREQMYSGKADYEAIRAVKEAVGIPVIMNGDVCDENSFLTAMEQTKADACMIGRGAVGNPHLFAEILHKDIPFNKLTCINEQFDKLNEFYDERYCVTTMRKQIVQYLKSEGASTEFKLKVMTAETEKEVLELLSNFFIKQ